MSVTGVTIHRWETGKAPVSISAYAKLAELYGASDIGMLTLPPGDREKVKAFREACRIVAELPDDKRASVALSPSVRLALLPELLTGPWLLANAALCAWLGWAAAQRD